MWKIIMGLSMIAFSWDSFAEDNWIDRIFLIRHFDLMDYAKDRGCKVIKSPDAIIIFSLKEGLSQKVGDRYSILTKSGKLLNSTLIQIVSGVNCMPLGADGTFVIGMLKVNPPIPWPEDKYGGDAMIAFKGTPPKENMLGNISIVDKAENNALNKEMQKLVRKGKTVLRGDYTKITLSDSTLKYVIASVDNTRSEDIYDDKFHVAINALFDATSGIRLIRKCEVSMRVFAVIGLGSDEFLMAISESGGYSGNYVVRKYTHKTLTGSTSKTLYS